MLMVNSRGWESSAVQAVFFKTPTSPCLKEPRTASSPAVITGYTKGKSTPNGRQLGATVKIPFSGYVIIIFNN